MSEFKSICDKIAMKKGSTAELYSIKEVNTQTLEGRESEGLRTIPIWLEHLIDQRYIYFSCFHVIWLLLSFAWA